MVRGVELTEGAFRSLLDARGVLQPGALAAPDASACYSVFAQRPDARLDHATITHQAAQFFAAKLGFTVDKKYDEAEPPEVDAVRVILACDDGSASGTRLVFGRRADPDDLANAADAEKRSNGYGLSLLAQRCPMIWLVMPESNEDRVALTIAAIFASTLLGPIVTPGALKIMGVRSARLELEKQGPSLSLAETENYRRRKTGEREQ